MISNYIKIAFRNLFKSKTYSSINIFGLSVGIACCLLILLYLTNEFSYDRFHENSHRIYRTWIHEDYGDGDIYWSTTSPIRLKASIEQHIPEAELISRRYVYTDQVKSSQSAESFSEAIQLVDPEFFQMFDFKLLKGDPEAVFAQPTNVVITESLAKRHFGTIDVLDKTILLKVMDDFKSFIITGLIEDSPSNSSITYQVLIPFEQAPNIFSQGAINGWFSVSPETYIQLSNHANVENTEAKLLDMMKLELGERWSESNYTVGLQPITNIHLNPDIPSGIATVSDPTYLYILGGIALLVLVIACVNFMTLSISRSTSRAKEVGIRKTIGAERTHLMYQFWGEAFLMTVIALGIGILFAELIMPYFNQLSGTTLDFGFNIHVVLLILGLVGFISLAAGIYPALILSGFKPVEVLKGKAMIKGDRSLFRTGMVTFQFTLSIFLIASTLIINDQLDFLRSKDLGYQKEQILIIQIDDNPTQETGFSGMMEEARQRTELLRSELSSVPQVTGIAVSLHTPADQGWMNADFRDTNDKKYQFNINLVDPNYPELMDFGLIQGRTFSENISSDLRQSMIINKAFADELGMSDPLNEVLPSPNFENHEIIGVVDNFNFASLRTEVQPLAMVINPMILFSGIDNIEIGSTQPKISLNVDSENLPETIKNIQKAWEAISPGEPFNYSFLDQAVDSQYRQEERLSKIVTFGSTLAIIIACLGLFGLASLMVVRRTKEIGVRKVLGANSSGIIILVNKEFTRLLVIAFILSLPLAWYAMHSWLQNFAYSIDIRIMPFIIAGALTLIVAWFTVSYQSFKAATINPTESLKGE